MKYNDYLNRIVAFNNDPRLVSLREKYNEPSFFEIISKERSETTYSSFLKWLFLINSSRSNGISPILSLLDILVKRSLQQKKDLINDVINDDLREAIVSRKLKISNITVKTEQYVCELAKDAARKKNVSSSMCSLLEEISNYCKDRIDLFIQGDVSLNQKKKQLQIIIENKIDSKEGGASTISGKPNKVVLSQEFVDFKRRAQTERYYIATNQERNDSLIQLYVYLTPLPSSRLDDFESLKKEQEQYKLEKKTVCILREDKHFIQINYQDILDYVVTPLLSSSVSERNRFFLEEFKNELAFPSIEGIDNQSCLAIGKDTSDLLSKYWEDYKDLIIPAIIASVGSEFYTLNGIFYLSQPRREIFKALIDKKSLEWDQEHWIIKDEKKEKNPGFIELFDGYQYKKGLRFNNIKKVAGEYDISVSEYKPETETSIKSLLKSFIVENGNLVFALMNGVKEEERKKVHNLIQLLSRRDSIKYTIYFDDKCEQTELGFSQTAYNIIKLWAEKVKGFSVTIKDLNDAFPRSINNYYERGKWFKSLIYLYKQTGEYEYDGEYEFDDKSDGKVKGTFDFLKKDKNRFKIKDGEEVVVLKMWHEDDVENLIRHIEEHELFKKHKLEIIRS